MDQQTSYRAGAKGAPNTVPGSAGLWELQTVKSDHGTYVLRFNLSTGDCFYLDLTRGGAIANGWHLIPSDSGMVVSDAGVTAGNTKATRGEKAERVTAGSI